MGSICRKKEEFIGGTLEDFGDSMDRAMFGDKQLTTKITDIQLKPNGKDSAWFEITGEEFNCGFDVSCGGICAGDEGWITFSGYMGHKFRMKSKQKD